MQFGKYLQPLYNHLRLNKAFATVANFMETREKSFRSARARALDRLMSYSRPEGQPYYTTKTGIFCGLRWPSMVYVGSVFAPKILGTYEVEIQALFAELVRAPWASTFIDIGAAEGYYAVGAALLNPKLRVIAFERQLDAHQHIKKLAAENAVLERIELHGEFDLAKLDIGSVGERPLVLMDVEGAESELINPRFVNCFTNASLIVEVHDFAVSGAARAVESALSRTHKVSAVYISHSARKALRSRVGLSRFDWQVATDEKRPKGNHWLIAIPRGTL